MIVKLLCWWNIHTGKYSKPWTYRSWTTSPEGVCTVTHWAKQERFCVECNIHEVKEIKTGTETYQPWAADYAEEMKKLEGK
jgi:hypothetical protein